MTTQKASKKYKQRISMLVRQLIRDRETINQLSAETGFPRPQIRYWSNADFVREIRDEYLRKLAEITGHRREAWTYKELKQWLRTGELPPKRGTNIVKSSDMEQIAKAIKKLTSIADCNRIAQLALERMESLMGTPQSLSIVLLPEVAHWFDVTMQASNVDFPKLRNKVRDLAAGCNIPPITEIRLRQIIYGETIPDSFQEILVIYTALRGPNDPMELTRLYDIAKQQPYMPEAARNKLSYLFRKEW